MTKKISVEKGAKLKAVEKQEPAVQDELAAAGIPELSEEEKEFARMTTRKNFNEAFSKWAIIEPENGTDEDIEAAKKDFQDCIDENRNKKYLIATHDDGLALKTAEFLREWNAKFNTWSAGSFKGLIQFERVITPIIEELKKDSKKDFEIDYSTLIFLYQSMNTPSGTGLESARQMALFENYNEETGKVFEENIPVTYSGVLEKIQLEVKALSNLDKKLSILKERVNLAYAGLKMTLKISEIEEFLEFYEAINAHAIDNDPDVKAAVGEADKK